MLSIWIFYILAIVVAALPFLILFRKDQEKMGKSRAILLSSLRGLSFLLVLFLLYPKHWLHKKSIIKKPTVVILEDVSNSVGNWVDYATWQDSLSDLSDDLSKDFDVVQYQFGAQVLQQEKADSFALEATNISGALEELWKRYPSNQVQSVIIATDGIYNQGMDPYYLNYPMELPHVWIGLGDSSLQKDVAILPTLYPKKIKLGQSAHFKIALQAQQYKDRKSSLKVSVAGKEAAVFPLDFNHERYYETLEWDWEPEKVGWYEIEISTPFLAGEVNSKNNSQTVFVEVVEEPFDVLIWAAAPHPDVRFLRDLERFLSHSNFTIHYGTTPPTQLSDYALVITHQLPNSIDLPTNKGLIQILGAYSTPEALSKWNLPPLRQLPSSQELDVEWDKHSGHFPEYFAVDLAQSEAPPMWFTFQIPMAAVNDGVILATYKGPSNIFAWMKTSPQPALLINGVGWWKWHLQENRVKDTEELLESPSMPQSLFLNWMRYMQHLFSGKKLEAYSNQAEYYNYQPILVTAQVFDDFLNAYEEEVLLELRKGEELLETFSMQASSPQSWQVDLGHWSNGLYEFKVYLKDHKAYVSNGFFEIHAQSLEELNLEAYWHGMQQWAELSEGVFVDWRETNSIKDWYASAHLNEPIAAEVGKRERAIDWKWWFGLILLSLTMEWILRKRWNGYRNI